ncbi:hypothetical protein SK128_007722, partial [Halocaridina rubra]
MHKYISHILSKCQESWCTASEHIAFMHKHISHILSKRQESWCTASELIILSNVQPVDSIILNEFFDT